MKTTWEQARDWFMNKGHKSEVVRSKDGVERCRTESRLGNVVITDDFHEGIEKLMELEREMP